MYTIISRLAIMTTNSELPPSSVCFSVEGINGGNNPDYESDITGPCHSDDDDEDRSHPADAYYFHAIDDDDDDGDAWRNNNGGCLRSSTHAVDGSGRGASFRRSRTAAMQRRELERHHEDVVMALKMQIARQQETIDILSCRLGQCEDEREALQTEKCVLVDELARAIKEQPDTRRRWFPKGERVHRNLSELDRAGGTATSGRCRCSSTPTPA